MNNAILEGANTKLIDHLHNLNNLYSAHGVEIFDAPEFLANMVLAEGRNKNDILLFFLVLGYEIRDWDATSIEDYGKIENLITQLTDIETENDDQASIKNLSLYLLHMYFVFDDLTSWVNYAKTNKLIGRTLREKMLVSFEHLRLGSEALGKISDSDNIILQTVKESEYGTLKRVYISFVDENRNPDISAFYLFADQLESQEFYKIFANQVFKKVTSLIVQ